MTLSEARDWAILALAALGVVQALVVVVVGLTLLRQAKEFRRRTGPFLDSATHTMANLRTASWLLSRLSTWPVIRAVSLGVGLWRGLRVLVKALKKKKEGKR